MRTLALRGLFCSPSAPRMSFKLPVVVATGRPPVRSHSWWPLRCGQHPPLRQGYRTSPAGPPFEVAPALAIDAQDSQGDCSAAVRIRETLLLMEPRTAHRSCSAGSLVPHPAPTPAGEGCVAWLLELHESPILRLYYADDIPTPAAAFCPPRSPAGHGQNSGTPARQAALTRTVMCQG